MSVMTEALHNSQLMIDELSLWFRVNHIFPPCSCFEKKKKKTIKCIVKKVMDCELSGLHFNSCSISGCWYMSPTALEFLMNAFCFHLANRGPHGT